MLADELRAAFLTAGLTEEQRAQLIEVGEEVPFERDDVPFVEGESADFLWMLLEGNVELSRRSGTEVFVMMTMSTAGQWAGGLRAWSDGAEHAAYRATGRAVSSGRFFRVPSDDLGRLVSEWFPFGKHMTVGIYQTIRGIEAVVRQRESLVALGTLAAGLAHEINNPAAASLRAVAAMRTTCDTMLSSLTDIARSAITSEQYVALDALRVEAQSTEPPGDGPLALADREEVIGEWLSRQGVDHGWEVAPVLAAAGLDVAWCERVRDAVGSDALDGAMRWTASVLEATTLLDVMQDTTTRISDLVGAVKSYSQMDRASLQHFDVHDGLESTLLMLGHKLDSVQVERDFAPGIPEIDAYAAELNQVWTNLIDNAIDAMEGQGTLRLVTRREGSDLVVEIVDTGPGMSSDALDHAFDPFFTTKDVGKGTGLGLDISRRVITERHGGEITLDPTPDGTTARVRLSLSR